ncbi:hypothetical protein [Pontibacter roseus]|uniref:hypothetical protein n=1 Tax=Pontibacter roseus TaxID=336989 RepID=UPI0003629D60|nr:hypothetical protein [Pontibacter roseus]
MKALQYTLVLAVSLISLIALQSCKEDDHKLQLRFYYQNNSDRTLVIYHYRTNGRVEYFKMAPQGSVQFLNVNSEGEKHHQPTDFDKFFQQNPVIDSVYVIFDLERLQRYTLNDGKPRSILDVANYQSSEKGKNTFEFMYEFAEVDYEGAE